MGRAEADGISAASSSTPAPNEKIAPVTTLQLGILAIVQGITEFLPVSSSGHLRLVPVLTGWPDQGLAIDIAVHLGSLGAVLLYFWRDVLAMVVGVMAILRGRGGPAALLVSHLAIATLPIVVVGAVLLRYGYDGGALAGLRGIELVGWTMLGFGVLLLAADRLGMTIRRIEHMRAGSAVFIGLAQVLALVPGTSRAGITMTAARMLGFERPEAARFSLLMSVPTIIASASPSAVAIYRSGQSPLGVEAALAALLAFTAALVAIPVMMHWLKRASFTPFVVYRVLLGGAILVWFYW